MPDFTPMPLADEFEQVSNSDWVALAEKTLKEGSLKSLTTTTADGISVKPLYSAADSNGRTTSPGSDVWDIRALIMATTPEAANRASLEELMKGSTSLLLDLFTVGSTDLSQILNDIYPEMTTISLHPNPYGIEAAEKLLGLWQSKDLSSCKGDLGLDPLGNSSRYGGEPNWEGIVDVTNSTQDHPEIHSVTVDSTVYAEAGASEAWELACSLSTAVAYLRHLQHNGIEPSEASTSFTFTYSADTDQFLTMAKFRAARHLWQQVQHHCGITPTPQHQTAITSAAMLTCSDPWMNLLRTTVAAFAAGTSGANAVTSRPFDTPLGQPDEFGQRLARNTQLLLTEESGLGKVIDPGGGSWYLENLTKKLSEESWKRFQSIEAEGGMEVALANGKILSEIENTWEVRKGRLKSGEASLIGVNIYPNSDEKPLTRPLSPRSPNGPFKLRRWSELFEESGNKS
ncbi:MAG TPA: methylmalonyl-CoA mutase subunit beta [Acidimicrobiales bacterium]|nr:methylmalonyl-CoA mutase subunit beta [Acidimicrobiales bacterium]